MTRMLWWFAENSLTVAVLIVFVATACRFLKHRPAIQHALWLVVLIKLVTPPVIAWPWTPRDLAGWVSPPPQESFTVTESVVVAETSVAREPVSIVADIPETPSVIPSLVVDELDEPAGTLPPEDIGTAAVAMAPAIEAAIEPAVEAPMLPVEKAVDEPVDLWSDAPLALFWLWGAGGVVVLCVQCRRMVKHRAIVRRGIPAPAALANEAAEIAGRLRLRPLAVSVVSGIASPFVWCLGRLKLVWPEGLTSDADVRRSRGVIAHELAHVKRRDHWVAWLELTAQVIWWWNPLFWFVRRRLRESAEMSCDAVALSTLPGDRRAYAEMFLELSTNSKSAVPAAALGISNGSSKTFERRLTMMLSDRVSGKLSLWGFLFVAAVAAAAMPAWSLADHPPQSADDLAAPAEKPLKAEKRPVATYGEARFYPLVGPARLVTHADGSKELVREAGPASEDSSDATPAAKAVADTPVNPAEPGKTADARTKRVYVPVRKKDPKTGLVVIRMVPRADAPTAGETPFYRDPHTPIPDATAAPRKVRVRIPVRKLDPKTGVYETEYVERDVVVADGVRAVAGPQTPLTIVADETPASALSRAPSQQARRVYEAELAVLELQILEAEVRYKAAVERQKNIEKLSESGAVPREKFLERRFETQLAEIALKKAKADLELFKAKNAQFTRPSDTTPAGGQGKAPATGLRIDNGAQVVRAASEAELKAKIQAAEAGCEIARQKVAATERLAEKGYAGKMEILTAKEQLYIAEAELAKVKARCEQHRAQINRMLKAIQSHPDPNLPAAVKPAAPGTTIKPVPAAPPKPPQEIDSTGFNGVGAPQPLWSPPKPANRQQEIKALQKQIEELNRRLEQLSKSSPDEEPNK